VPRNNSPWASVHLSYTGRGGGGGGKHARRPLRFWTVVDAVTKLLLTLKWEGGKRRTLSPFVNYNVPLSLHPLVMGKEKKKKWHAANNALF